jgi:hypothetical protein
LIASRKGIKSILGTIAPQTIDRARLKSEIGQALLNFSGEGLTAAYRREGNRGRTRRNTVESRTLGRCDRLQGTGNLQENLSGSGTQFIRLELIASGKGSKGTLGTIPPDSIGGSWLKSERDQALLNFPR